MLTERLEVGAGFLICDLAALDILQEAIHPLDCAVYIGHTFEPDAVIFLQARFRIFHHRLNVE